VKACGLIVEYNPFHNGHQYHVEEAKKNSNADCIIAVMSGTFLQRGEPAIIDKFHRTKAALKSGVDLVVELPYPYAVQSSRYFALGALRTLHALHTAMICFGSESGEIEPFYNASERLLKRKEEYDDTVRSFMKQGLSFPQASQKAYEKIGLQQVDLFQPNNILGFSYVRTIVEERLPIKALTIKRKQSHYHDTEIVNQIASATSIRQALLKDPTDENVARAVPPHSLEQMITYKEEASLWHDWEDYFNALYLRITSLPLEELRKIHGVEEGIEYRIKEAITKATSFHDLIERVKTKRYTYVRLQRMFAHILTNTKKQEIEPFLNANTVPYIRLLGMNERGQTYLNKKKKALEVPLVTNLTYDYPALCLDERAMNVYYSILPVTKRLHLRKQEFQLPIIV